MKRVVVDVDGVLLDIHSALEKQLQAQGYDFSMSRVLTYDFNKSLPQDKVPDWLINSDKGYEFFLNVPRSKIFEELGNVELFKTADFYEDAIQEIKDMVLSHNAQVIISTQSFTEEIANVKKERLLDRLAGYPIEYKDFIGDSKGIIEEADYVIEDCISNIDMYDCHKVLVSKPYNQPEFNTSKNVFKDIHIEPSSYAAIRSVAYDICF